MLKDILAAFKSETPKTLSTTDARVALAALLVRVAKADENYADVEIDMIDRVLEARYELPRIEAATLRQEAETLEENAPDIVRFTRVVKESVDYEDRMGVVEALWSVALADGARADEENNFLRMAVNLLGVNDRDSAIARQNVSAKSK